MFVVGCIDGVLVIEYVGKMEFVFLGLFQLLIVFFIQLYEELNYMVFSWILVSWEMVKKYDLVIDVMCRDGLILRIERSF